MVSALTRMSRERAKQGPRHGEQHLGPSGIECVQIAKWYGLGIRAAYLGGPYAEARLSSASGQQRDGVAARRARAAPGCAAHWCALFACRSRPGIDSTPRGLRASPQGLGLDQRQQPSDRLSLGAKRPELIRKFVAELITGAPDVILTSGRIVVAQWCEQPKIFRSYSCKLLIRLAQV